MVTFSPEVQSSPGYPFQSDQSRPIQEPRPNVSKEIALKGLGSAVEGGAEVATGLVEGNIRSELHAGLDRENDAAIARLESVKLSPSLLEQSDPTRLPSGLDGLDKTLNTLDMARKGDKYSQTYLDARRDMVLKQVRSDHPGFRDYIDDTNAKYTREDPANKYITSLIGDINSFKTAANEKRTKTEAQIWKGADLGWDGAQEMMRDFKAGKLGKDPESQVLDWVYKHTKQDYEKKKAADELAKVKDNRELEAFKAQDNITAEAARTVTNTLDTMYTTSGIKLSDYPHKMLAGEAENISGAEAEQLGDAVMQRESLAYQKFIKWANTPDEKTNKSPAQLVEPNKLKELWATQSQRFKDTAELYKNKDFGLASAAHRIDEKVVEQKDHQLLSDKDIGSVYQNAKVIAKMGPGFGSELGKSVLEAPGLLQSINDYFTKDVLKAVAQPRTLLQPEGKPFTMKEGIEKAADVNMKEDELASYAKGTLNLVDKISDPKYPDVAKASLAKFAFDPANAGLLDKFAKDNQADVYSRLYSYGNIKEMHKLGRQDPRLWENFKTTAYNHFGSSLLHTQLMDLNEIAPNPNLSISWDSEQHQFGVHQWNKTGKNAAAANAMITADYLKAKNSIDAINKGLQSISNISKIETRDPNTDILNFLLSAGVSGGSIPAGMLQAVKSSKKRPNFEGPE